MFIDASAFCVMFFEEPEAAEFKAKITIRKTPGDGGKVYENLTIRAANPVVAE